MKITPFLKSVCISAVFCFALTCSLEAGEQKNKQKKDDRPSVSVIRKDGKKASRKCFRDEDGNGFCDRGSEQKWKCPNNCRRADLAKNEKGGAKHHNNDRPDSKHDGDRHDLKRDGDRAGDKLDGDRHDLKRDRDLRALEHDKERHDLKHDRDRHDPKHHNDRPEARPDGDRPRPDDSPRDKGDHPGDQKRNGGDKPKALPPPEKDSGWSLLPCSGCPLAGACNGKCVSGLI